MDDLALQDINAVKVEFNPELNGNDVIVPQEIVPKFASVKESKKITRKDVVNAVIPKGKSSVTVVNNHTKKTAVISKKSVQKMFSTIFTSEKIPEQTTIEKKEIIANAGKLFPNAQRIAVHNDVKGIDRSIERYASVVNAGGNIFFVMFTAKENKCELKISGLSLYDLKCEKAVSTSSPSLSGHRKQPDYIIADLVEFVKCKLSKYSKDKGRGFNNIDLSFKKNNIDELFFNLSENPEGFKNKDFRYTLSLIYQTVEDEFEGVFLSPNAPARNTNFYLVNNNGKLSFFVTPTNNFEYYLKSKGSLFRFRPEVLGNDIGYSMNLDLVMDYFGGFGNVVDIEGLTPTFVYLNKLTYFVMKLVEKMYFIPTVKTSGQTFRIVYEPIIATPEMARIVNIFEENTPEDLFIKGGRPKNFINDFIYTYMNYVVYKFLGIKSYKFKDVKSGAYMVKDLEQRAMTKGADIAGNLSGWFDELYLGKYDVIPFFKIERLEDELFRLKVHIKNRKTGEDVLIDKLYSDGEVFGANASDIARIVEKQLNYAIRYMPELETLFEDESRLCLNLNLSEVYRIITRTAYYLQKAQIEVILPKELVNIVVPRASINAKVKAARTKELSDILNNASSSKISLDDILDFSYEVVIGDDRISAEEFNRLAENSSGLVKYKNKYVLVDKDESKKIFEQVAKSNFKALSRMDLIHASMSGQLKEYDFNYDDAFAKIIQDFNKPVEVSVPSGLQGELRPYQKTGLKWLWTNISKGFGTCMADDMGLGKTIQVISLILKMKEEAVLNKPVLVVCPTTLMGNWMKELEMFGPSLDAVIYHGAERQLDLKHDIILTTYAVMRIDIEEFKKHHWGIIVVDEAQNIKNPDTAQTLAIKILKSDVKIAMTGTPVENRLTELWSIFDFINQGYLGTLKEFQKSYAIPIERFKENSRAAKLKMSVSPFVLRRLKTDKNVISDLPEKVALNDYCYLSKPQAVLYEKILNEMMEKISGFTGINRRGNIFKLITALKQICNHPYQFLKSGEMNKEMSGKLDKCVSIVQNIIDNDEKTLIFTQYKKMGEILTRVIAQECNTEPLFFHGSLNVSRREELINKFQNNYDTKVMILSLKAGGTGLNLTSATNVIHYDLWWNPAVEDQATDRTYRIGQDKNVMVHRMITLGTFEEKIDEMLKSKKELADLAVYEGEKIITELSDEEIYEIFTLSG
ncbi:MAG: DEAD/DEAH box helicase family protein [Heliobacteriaceae bacterium]|jgi:SNF2 family DNA or RNA helicase|nr:DEAD/DEAH box helicase family protein [Heliobacteriaceae bacterium]